ncbi:MAG: hypothetical protein V3U87_14200 [Methylococcaceae bacterium]
MEKPIPLSHQFQAMDFTSYQQLTADNFHVKQLITSYQKTFSDPDVWAENYSEKDVDNKLKNELAGDAYLRMVMEEKQNQIAAFCWAQLLNADEILTSIRSIQYYQTLGEPDLKQPLLDTIGNESVLYIHDLAIMQEYRGQINLRKLILPVLQNIATCTGINKIFFWSIEGTRISSLADRAGIDLATTSDSIQFFAVV